MHNTDRIQQFMESNEFAPNGQGEYFGGQQEYQEFAGSQGEYAPSFEAEYIGELVNPATGEINQEAEMAMAAELLSVSNEQELNHFLGGLVRNLGRTFRNVAGSPLGSMLGGALRSVAKAALPVVGGALGTLIPIPGVGTAVGTALGKAAGSALGLEAEGLSNEDREFEVARRVIRIGIEGARAFDSAPEGEFTSQYELGSVLSSIASKVLPSIGSAVLNGLTGQASSGGQATGGLSGGLQVSSPGGWNLRLGGQAGGQATAGTGIGINAPAPGVPFQPAPPNQVIPQRQNGAGPMPPVGPHGKRRGGWWSVQGNNIVLHNVFRR
jgi:hypothetical protein